MSENDRKIRVLICDDDPADRSLVRQLLKRAPGFEFELVEVEDGCGLMTSLVTGDFDVVILDVQLPGRSGIEWLAEVNALDAAPVIVATGHGDEMVAVEAMKAGAYDYLPKMQFSVSSITRAIVNSIERWNLARQVDEFRKRILVMARTDELTGLLNRRSLIETLKQEFESAHDKAAPLSVVMMDIDHFKRVNDTYGHDVGDVVLTGVCRAVEKALDNGAVFGRYGGEEFLVLLPGRTLDDAVGVADDCRRAVEEAILLDSPDLKVKATVSLGVAVFEYGMRTYDDLIKQADLALFRAKEGGRNRVASARPVPLLKAV